MIDFHGLTGFLAFIIRADRHNDVPPSATLSEIMRARATSSVVDMRTGRHYAPCKAGAIAARAADRRMGRAIANAMVAS